MVAACAVAFLAAACASTGSGNLRGTAQQLNAASTRFYTEARYEGDDNYRGRISRYAEGLSKAAEGLDRAVHRGESPDEVEEQYRRVVDRYGQLHDGLAAEGYAEQSKRLLESFDHVTAAYRTVQSAMSARFASEKGRMHY
jgi:hypothetical protein